jgi:hypothetical protein
MPIADTSESAQRTEDRYQTILTPDRVDVLATKHNQSINPFIHCTIAAMLQQESRWDNVVEVIVKLKAL